MQSSDLLQIVKFMLYESMDETDWSALADMFEESGDMESAEIIRCGTDPKVVKHALANAMRGVKKAAEEEDGLSAVDFWYEEMEDSVRELHNVSPFSVCCDASLWCECGNKIPTAETPTRTVCADCEAMKAQWEVEVREHFQQIGSKKKS